MTKKNVVVFDGKCQFCRASARMLLIMDLFSVLGMVDFQQQNNLAALHPELTREKAASQLYLIEPDGTLFGGFFALRRFCFKLPMFYPLLPLMYFPGMDLVGPRVYRWVAENRYFFHLHHSCKNNACFR